MIRYNTSRGVRSYVVEDEVTTNKTSYTFKLLDPSTEYIFNVKSYTKDGMSSKVAIVQATMKGREGINSMMYDGLVIILYYRKSIICGIAFLQQARLQQVGSGKVQMATLCVESQPLSSPLVRVGTNFEPWLHMVAAKPPLQFVNL